MPDRRLLCVYQHAPTPGAPGIYRHRMLFAELARRGWSVDLVSTARNYMTGDVPLGYRGRLASTEEIDGIAHHWVWSSGRIHDARHHRALNYLTFAGAAATRSGLLPRPSAVMVSSPPLTVGSLGPLLAARFRRPWILDVRDVWPESAAAVGWLSEGSPLYRTLAWEAGRLTRSASAVVVQSPGLMRDVLRRGASSVSVVPGALVDAPPDLDARRRIRAELGIDPGSCLFVYVGAVGLANSVDVLVDAVCELPEEIAADLVIVGDGSARAALEVRVAAFESRRVTMIGAVPKARVADYLAAADCCLHSLRPDGVFRYSFPTKLLEYLGAHRPFVTTAPGYPEHLARSSGGGFAPDAAELGRELRRWAAMTVDERSARGEQAYAFGQARFGLASVVDRLEAVLEGVGQTRAWRHSPPAACPVPG